jgi:hypothetical protein
MLWTLLRRLLRWVARERVPVRAGAVEAARAELEQPDENFPSTPGDAIQDLLHAVTVPVLVLLGEWAIAWARLALDPKQGLLVAQVGHACIRHALFVLLSSFLHTAATCSHPCSSTDEAQSLFLPTMGGKLDAAGAEYVRDVFVKYLLVYGPRTMLWCLTGSSMALTWVSIASMPPNGYALITGIT